MTGKRSHPPDPLQSLLSRWEETRSPPKHASARPPGSDTGGRVHSPSKDPRTPLEGAGHRCLRGGGGVAGRWRQRGHVPPAGVGARRHPEMKRLSFKKQN